MRCRCSILICWVCVAVEACAQTLTLPNRSGQAFTGSDFVWRNESISLNEREAEVREQVLSGNVPDFLRTLRPVEVTNIAGGKTNVGRFFVTPDYLALGSNEDYMLVPLSPESAQHIANSLDCLLPTPKMVDAIYAAAEVKLSPAPIPPSPAMTTLSVFAQHNDVVRTQRAALLKSYPLGALIAGHKKDVVISARLAAMTNKVAIYGWHRPDGKPIQPLYTGHAASWVDYSHGIRLVHQAMLVNGEPRNVAEVLSDPQLAPLISDEGVITNFRYPTVSSETAAKPNNLTWPAGFVPGTYPGELIRQLTFPDGVRVLINAPGTNAFASNRPVLLILYALPNGNTIEQTIGKQPSPGVDWHFHIQHIGAQTRFLRQAISNRTVVVAYLENSLKSWPAWRRQHGDAPIPKLIEAVKEVFGHWPVRIVLTGHSGGGSLTFGFLNTQTDVPPEVERIAFLDSNYAYEASAHAGKLTRWLTGSTEHHLCVLAYHDASALLDGKPFVSEQGGTWGRSHAMLQDLAASFTFHSQTNGTLQTHEALAKRIQFQLMENPERKVLHTVQVERNGFIQAMLSGTTQEGIGYEYLGERAYERWITAD